MWAGIAGAPVNGNSEYDVSISIHDSVYNTDFTSSLLKYNANDSVKQANDVEDHVITTLRAFAKEHSCKFLGAGVTMAILRDVRVHPFVILPLDLAYGPRAMAQPACYRRRTYDGSLDQSIFALHR
jgi:hypothetical protein